MRTKLGRLLQIIVFPIFFIFIFCSDTTKVQAECSTSSVAGTVTGYSGGMATVEVSGCIDFNQNDSYEFVISGQGSENILFTSNTPLGKGAFTDTASVAIPEGIAYLQVTIRNRTNSEDEVATSGSDSMPIPGIATPSDPGAANLDLITTFVGGAGSTTNIGDIYDTPASLVNLLIRNLFVIAGIILFITILWAGFKFIQSGAKGKDEAKTIITVAITGFIIMFAAYWIVQIIGIVTGTGIIPPALE